MLHLTVCRFSDKGRLVGEADLEVCRLFAFSISAFQREKIGSEPSHSHYRYTGGVRGRGSGFQQHRFSRVWCSVSPGNSGRLDCGRHVAFRRQTQVRILQTQSKTCRRESPNSWCDPIRSCSRPQTAGEGEGRCRRRSVQSATEVFGRYYSSC